jgi:hypothetical protein
MALGLRSALGFLPAWAVLACAAVVFAMSANAKAAVHTGQRPFITDVTRVMRGSEPGLSPDRFDVPTAEPDIIKLMIGEFAQCLAGHAGVVPAIQRGQACVNQLDETVSGDRAKRRWAGRLRSGHGVFLYKRLIPGAVAPVTR